MKIAAIVQARTGSSRLPKKILKDLCGVPVLIHVINRLKKCNNLNEIIIATTEKEQDDVIVDLVKNQDVLIFRGSEEDVLDRYYQAAKINHVDIVVRVTSDDPLIDFRLVDKIIEKLLTNKSDYSCNNIPSTYPLGLDCECFTFNALEKAWKDSKKQREREHVTPYIRENENIFKQSRIINDADYSHLRWTLDTIEDYKYIKYIYENLYTKNKYFVTEDILEFLGDGSK